MQSRYHPECKHKLLDTARRAQLEARKKAEQQKEELRKVEEALALAKVQKEKDIRAQECRCARTLLVKTASNSISKLQGECVRCGVRNKEWGGEGPQRHAV